MCHLCYNIKHFILLQNLFSSIIRGEGVFQLLNIRIKTREYERTKNANVGIHAVPIHHVYQNIESKGITSTLLL